MTAHPSTTRPWQALLSGAERDRALAVVHAIAGELRAYADRGAGPELSSTLAGGEAGLAVFFAYLDRAFPGRGHDATAATLLGRAADSLAAQEMGVSLYAGFPGICWAVAHLQREGLPGPGAMDLSGIDEALLRAVTPPGWAWDYDLVSGLVGICAYALERHPDPVAGRIVEAVVARLAETAETRGDGAAWFTPPHRLHPETRARHPQGWYNAGMAHGAPGAIAVLGGARAQGRLGPEGLALLDAAVRWVTGSPAPGGPSLVPGHVTPSGRAEPTRLAWCYGDPGVAVALLAAGRAAGRPAWEARALELMRRAGTVPFEQTGVRDAPLCHGAAGLAHLFARIHQLTGDPALAEHARGWYRRTLQMRDPGVAFGGYAFFSTAGGRPGWRVEPGLLEGAAGIGLALLSAAFDLDPAWDRFLLASPFPGAAGEAAPGVAAAGRWSPPVPGAPAPAGGRPLAGGLVPPDFAVVRSPLLPLDEFVRWSEGLRAPGASADELPAALASDRAVLRARLARTLERPEVREALFLASPELEAQLPAWLQDATGRRGAKLDRAVAKYFARMCSRPTPFGLFAGCSVAGTGDHTRLRLAPLRAYRRHTRLDTEYLSQLAEALDADPALARSLVFRPNSSLYRAAGRLHLVETHVRGRERSHHLVAFDLTPYLETALERAAAGATLGEVAAALVGADVDLEEALEYVHELARSQILVSGVAPAVTGPEPIHEMEAALRAHAPSRPVADGLARTRAAMERIDGGGLGAAPARYREVASGLEALPSPVELSRLFQVDMTKPGEALCLGRGVLAEVARGIELLYHLAPPPYDALKGFRDAFEERYDRREVPLTEALDDEAGIGFTPDPWEPRGPERHAWLLPRVFEAWTSNAREVRVTEAELRALGPPASTPPDAFSVMARVVAASAEAVEAGDFQVVLDGMTGPSGANLLGRFCHADPALHARVVRHLREEEALRPGAVFAEVVHLPMGRMGNVLCRPVLRGYEIPFLGRSGAPAERQIPIDDLRVSVADGRVVLRSTRLGREVQPRLSTAHNHRSAGNLRLYQFLCALQEQGSASVGWSWGPLHGAPFLPRVTCGRVVLAPALWQVPREEAEALARGSDAERYAAVQAWRRARRLPRYVLVVQGDHQMLVDLDNGLSVEVMLDLLATGRGGILQELLPGPGELCLESAEGRFTHELLVPFVRSRSPAPGAPPSRRAAAGARSFAPGSEWLYAKLYGGAALADRVLTGAVGPVAGEAAAAGAIDRWFFIRYGDPHPHLRVRFHGPPEALRACVLPRLERAARELLGVGALWKVQYDTYEREVERYGGAAGVAYAEEVFHADSEAVLALLRAYGGDEGAGERWLLAFRGVDQLMADFALPPAARRDALRDVAGRPAARRQWGERFRKERATLERALSAGVEGGPLDAGIQVLASRSRRLREAAAALCAADRGGRLGVPLRELVLSFTHLYVNRLLRTDQKAQELEIYHLLYRCHESSLARGPAARP